MSQDTFLTSKSGKTYKKSFTKESLIILGAGFGQNARDWKPTKRITAKTTTRNLLRLMQTSGNNSQAGTSVRLPSTLIVLTQTISFTLLKLSRVLAGFAGPMFGATLQWATSKA